jgi:hypothetical protein
LEALSTTLAYLDPTAPLPPFREWAISPDAARILVTEILRNKPRVVVECGSGCSTLLIGYCLKKLGEGTLFSLEHDEGYVEITRGQVQLHGLENIVTVIYAPLVEHNVNGKEMMWYDISGLEHIYEIDLLLIDGPPETVGELTRYPVFPLLGGRFAPRATVILDDAARADERRVVAAWLTEYNGLTCARSDTEKGTAVFRVESKLYSKTTGPGFKEEKTR